MSRFSMDHKQLFSCSFFWKHVNRKFVWFLFGVTTGGEWNKKIHKISQKNPHQVSRVCDRMSF